MTTPTKPERVEVGRRDKPNQYNVKPGDRLRRVFNDDDWEHGEVLPGGRYFVFDAKMKSWCSAPGTSIEINELTWSQYSWLDAPATPGTATVTPESHWECRPHVGAGDWSKCINGGPEGCDKFWREANRTGKREYRLVHADGTTGPASKPPASPTYGRLVGELRAPDGTPRTALEAIRAKREPEPWVPSVDEWDLLPDVDVRR